MVSCPFWHVEKEPRGLLPILFTLPLLEILGQASVVSFDSPSEVCLLAEESSCQWERGVQLVAVGVQMENCCLHRDVQHLGRLLTMRVHNEIEDKPCSRFCNRVHLESLLELGSGTNDNTSIGLGNFCCTCNS